MKYTHILFLLGLYACLSQETYNLSGYIIDQNNGETLIGANIYNQTSKTGTTSNEYGYFSINIPQGKNTLKCSYIGYINETLQIVPSRAKFN